MQQPPVLAPRPFVRRRGYEVLSDGLNPDLWGRSSIAALVIAFGLLLAATVVFTFLWITIANENRQSKKAIASLETEFEDLEAIVASFDFSCNCSGVNFTFPTEFADDEFHVFSDADTSKRIEFNADGISASTLQSLTIQDALGTIVRNFPLLENSIL